MGGESEGGRRITADLDWDRSLARSSLALWSGEVSVRPFVSP